jgi:hypothetical protein
LINTKRGLSRNILLAVLALAVVIVVFLGLMLFRPPEPEFPELTVSFFDKAVNLTSFRKNFRANVTLSFPDKETWDLGEVPWFAETINIERTIPVNHIEGVTISGDTITYTLVFDNALVKDFLWSRIYHMGSSVPQPQKVSVVVYGDWLGTEVSASEELSIFSE